MVVLLLRAAKASLRGEVSRWMIEPEAGVFVGNLPARVRDKLWERVAHETDESAVMIFSARNEQGFEVRHIGRAFRSPVDFDGLTLIRQWQNRPTRPRLRLETGGADDAPDASA